MLLQIKKNKEVVSTFIAKSANHAQLVWNAFCMKVAGKTTYDTQIEVGEDEYVLETHENITI